MKKMTLWMAAVLFAAWAMADVRLDPVFTSNMMLQQGAPIAFFGTAPAEKDVTATLGDETVTVKSDAKGKWRAVFAPKGTPKDVIAKIAEAYRKACADQAIAQKITDMGYAKEKIRADSAASSTGTKSAPRCSVMYFTLSWFSK